MNPCLRGFMFSLQFKFIFYNQNRKLIMNSFCLYHQLSKQKSKQKTYSNSSQRSNKRSNRYEERSLFENKLKNSRYDYQDFNDYKIYPTNQTSNRVKIFVDKSPQKQRIQNKRNKRMQSLRFHKTLDQEYFMNEEKSFRSANSHKHKKDKKVASREHQQSQNQYKNSFNRAQQQFYENRIENLQNKIEELTRKLETCENETRKNRYEFILLRNIVEKLKIQNLQIISRITVEDNLIRHSGDFRIDEQLEGEFLSEKVAGEFRQRRTQDKTKVCIGLSEKEIKTNPNAAGFEEKMEYSLSDNEQKTEQSEGLENQNIWITKNLKPQCPTRNKLQNMQQQVPALKSKQKKTKLEQQTVQSNKKEIQINQAASNTKSVAKRSNKPKKILHFQNILKEELNKDEELRKGKQFYLIEELLRNQSRKEFQQSFSILSSQENLLESVGLIREKKYQQKFILNRGKGQIQSRDCSEHLEHDTSITCQQELFDPYEQLSQKFYKPNSLGGQNKNKPFTNKIE